MRATTLTIAALLLVALTGCPQHKPPRARPHPAWHVEKKPAVIRPAHPHPHHEHPHGPHPHPPSDHHHHPHPHPHLAGPNGHHHPY